MIDYSFSSKDYDYLKYLSIRFIISNEGTIEAEANYDIEDIMYELDFKKSKIHKQTLKLVVHSILQEISDDITNNVNKTLEQ